MLKLTNHLNVFTYAEKLVVTLAYALYIETARPNAIDKDGSLHVKLGIELAKANAYAEFRSYFDVNNAIDWHIIKQSFLEQLHDILNDDSVIGAYATALHGRASVNMNTTVLTRTLDLDDGGLQKLREQLEPREKDDQKPKPRTNYNLNFVDPRYIQQPGFVDPNFAYPINPLVITS